MCRQGLGTLVGTVTARHACRIVSNIDIEEALEDVGRIITLLPQPAGSLSNAQTMELGSVRHVSLMGQYS